ncbi:amidohydrolase family protein [Microbacterium sp. CFH 31415]|uniref:amidohydrolase n=1 Tax=Microbacterium sp. CFH 31415 TaxID=2921732 RepID=UPI001F14870E|nr:amidohydrolase family protein [Microbacterium sp. CFH 31415]MCH6231490.1 amidohydrolase family protein [Microbacterium sp. CFH 31415]
MSHALAADLVLFGGAVVTMAPEAATAADAEGLAIRAGEVVALGDRSTLQTYIAEGTRVIELADAAILPGFVDSHIHPVFGIDLTRGADLSRCRTLADVEASLRAEAAGLGAEDWLLGWGLDPNVFGEAPVSNAVLDEVAGDRRAFIRFFDAHAALASSAALEGSGVTGTEEFTDGSRVVTDASGAPTGYLLEMQAIHLVEATLPELSFDQRAEALYDVLLHMARAGFTSGQVQDLAPDAIQLLQTIEATRDLPIRLRMSPWYVPGAPLEEVSRLAEMQGMRGRRWIVEGVKLMIDGTVDNGTAWLHEPDCLGESTASLWLDPEQYRHALTELDRRGIPTTTHAIGDAGIDFVVRAIDGLADPRATHRVEHIETMTDAALEVFVSSRATASMQPTHCTLFTRADGSDNWSRRLGEERAGRGFRTRDLVRAGIPLALGSDWPVAPSDAVGILADAQLRRPHDDPHAVPVNPDQALDAMEALRGLTVEPYRSIGRIGGVLAVGSPADITVLDRDPRVVAPESLGEAAVLLTVVGGRIVVDADVS